MVDQSQAQYAKNGDVHIAYQVVGEGPINILPVPDWVISIEASWSWEGYERLWERLGSFGRLILTDARGSGSSDPAPPGDPAMLSSTPSTTFGRYLGHGRLGTGVLDWPYIVCLAGLSLRRNPSRANGGARPRRGVGFAHG